MYSFNISDHFCEIEILIEILSLVMLVDRFYFEISVVGYFTRFVCI